MVLYPNKLPESERVCSGICIFMATFPKFTSRYFFFYLPILLSLMVFSLFHSVGYKNHSVGYIFHTVKYKSHTVKQRIFQFI